MNFKSKKAGASVTELGLLAGLIAVLIITAVNATGNHVSTLFSTTGNSLDNIQSKLNSFEDTEPRIYTSCYDIKQDQADATSGTYEIDPDGDVGSIEPFNVHCDMVSDGGGYTLYNLSAAGQQTSPQIEAQCDAVGLELFVPRSQTHLDAAINQFNAASYALMGIYPNTNGARCDTVHFNSNECSTWSPTNGGHWYVEDYLDRAEPNGDNTTGYSMLYNFDGANLVTYYNDRRLGDTSYPNNYTTNMWVCSSPDDKNIAKTW